MAPRAAPAKLHIAFDPDPSPAARATVERGVDQHNVGITNLPDYYPLAFLLRDAAGEVLGGVLGRTSLGLLFIDLVYLPDDLRGGGLGSRILQAAEDEGRRRGCRAAVLYTISFQAPGFYTRRGWRVFGEIPCDPPGTSRIFMTKTL